MLSRKTFSRFSLLTILSFSLIGFFGCNKSDNDDDIYKATASDRQAAIEMVADGFSNENDGDYTDITAAVTSPTVSSSVGKISLDTSFTNPRGLSIHVYKKFVSSTGDSSNKYDVNHTKLYLKRDVSGTIQKVLRSFYMEIERHTILTVEGLGDAFSAWTLNGDRTARHYHSFNGRMDSTATYSYERILNSSKLENVIINKNELNKYPESGTLTYNLEINKIKSKNDKTKIGHFEITAKITFNGTNRPEIEVIDKQGNRLKYRVNVETGDLTPSLN